MLHVTCYLLLLTFTRCYLLPVACLVQAHNTNFFLKQGGEVSYGVNGRQIVQIITADYHDQLSRPMVHATEIAHVAQHELM